VAGRPERRKRGKPAGSGIQEDGSFEPQFKNQRAPFQPGHDLSLRHGAYADVHLGGRVEELADAIRPLVPGYSEADEVVLRVLCLALARLEASSAAVEGASTEQLARLRSDERGWANSIRRLVNDLGMTPTARARLGLVGVRAKGEAAAAYLAEKRAAEREVEGEAFEDESGEPHA